jgi:serine/threonine-protein kinase RsbW
VVVQVSDQGSWQEPRDSVERGRGLHIVELLVDEVAVEAGEGTTVVLRRRVSRAEP